MYCLLEISSSHIHLPHWLTSEQYGSLSATLRKSKCLQEIVELFSFFEEALEDLSKWCKETENYPEQLVRNQHAAERLCRGVLLELKTYLLQMDAMLARKYGKDSEIYKLYERGTQAAKNHCIEYAFALQLRDYSQHCNEVMQSFRAPVEENYIQPCCIPEELLKNYNNWGRKEKRFLSNAKGNIDLLVVFEKVREELEEIQRSLIHSLLAHDEMRAELLELRKWMDDSFSTSDCRSFQLAKMVYMNGKDAPKVAFSQKKITVRFDALPVDWMIIYKLTDEIAELQKAGV